METMPDVQGYLHMKEGKRSWKKHFFVLRASGLYYSTKGNSKVTDIIMIIMVIMQPFPSVTSL